MSDWIDKLKQDQNREAAEAAEKERARQRRHDLIRSLLPHYVEMLTNQMRADVEKLRAKFPNDARYDLHFNDDMPGFTLSHSSGYLPMEFRFRIDETQTMARAFISTKNRNSAATDLPMDLPVEIDVNNRLSVEFEQRKFYRAEDLAETIVRYVLNHGLKT